MGLEKAPHDFRRLGALLPNENKMEKACRSIPLNTGIICVASEWFPKWLMRHWSSFMGKVRSNQYDLSEWPINWYILDLHNQALSSPYRLFGGILSDVRILAQAHINDISPLTDQTESAIANRKCQCFLPISGPARVNDSMVRRVTGSLELFAFAVDVFS
jgi:hypothetical protein